MKSQSQTAGNPATNPVKKACSGPAEGRASEALAQPLPEDYSADLVIEALSEHFGPCVDNVGVNRRRSERKAWVVDLEVWLHETSTGDGVETCLRVTTRDLSTGGLSFIARRFVHPGTHMRTCFTALPTKPTVWGLVRNCVHLSGSFHRVGVQFVTPPIDIA